MKKTEDLVEKVKKQEETIHSLEEQKSFLKAHAEKVGGELAQIRHDFLRKEEEIEMLRSEGKKIECLIDELRVEWRELHKKLAILKEKIMKVKTNEIVESK